MRKTYIGVKRPRKIRKHRSTMPELQERTPKGQILNTANDHANTANPQTIKDRPAVFAVFSKTPEQQNTANTFRSVIPGHRPACGVCGVCGVYLQPNSHLRTDHHPSSSSLRSFSIDESSHISATGTRGDVMTAHEAKVEVLTAEVRVLMVGSRQVTLSVYNQLDYLHRARIEPFGRVSPRGADSGRVYVVGRDRETGVLARARTPHWGEELDERRYRELASELTRTVLAEVKNDDESVTCAMNVLARLSCASLLPVSYYNDGTDLIREAMQGAGMWHEFDAVPHSLRQRAKAIREGQPGTEPEPGSHDEQAAQLVASYAAAIEKARTSTAAVAAEWSALPLIVLAGLR